MKMKKIVSLFLVALMAFSVIPTGVFTLSVSAVQSDAYATIITGSDYQDSSVRQANVTALLSQIKAGGYTNTPDGVFFGGDYSNSSMNTDATEGTTELMGLITDAYPDFNPDNAVFIQGNHDAQTGYVVAPYEHEFPDYITYALNEDVFASYQSQGTVEALAKKLQTYLSELIAAGDTRPVFVLSHVPLHASERKDNTYAKIIVDVLNEAAESLDIVFMFGHNHSSDYDDYIGGAVNYIAKGEDLRVFNLGSDTEYTESPINFTYMNYGYVGYSGNADSNTSTSTLTMGVFELCPTTIEISRYSKTGLYTTETINLINPKVTTPYVSISGNTTVTQGDGDTVTAKIQNFTNPTYTWTSSNTDAVKISGTGKSAQLIYTAPGTSTITLTVTDEDGTTVSDSYEVTVTGKTYEYVYHEGETYYTYDLVDGPTDGGEYVIASSNTAGDTTAMSNTISSKAVTAVSVTVESGTDEIPAAHITNPDSTAIWKATTNSNGGYTLSNTSLSSNANLRAKDNKTAELKNNTDKTAAWTYTSNQLYNSDKGAYISYNGTAYAVSTSGTNVYFYEKTEHQTEAWTETVEHELTYSPASALTMGGIDTDGKTHKYYEITLGDTLTLVGSFSGFGENAGNVTVTWSSSNDSVASVDNGVVTFNGDGAATISFMVSDGETTLTKSVDFVLSRAQKPTFTFKLTDTLEDGKTYIIASSNTAGSTNVMTDSVLYLDGNWMPNRLNYISQTIEEIDGEMTMIVEDETAFWTASDDGTGQIMLVSEDSGKILRAASTGITLLDSASDDGIYWTVSGNSISNDRGYGPQVSGEGGFRAESSGTNYLYELVQTDPYTTLKADGISVDGKTQTLYSVTDTSTATLVGSYFNFGAGITQQWISSDETIATVSNGVVSFTGKEGTVDITYRVTDESGAEVVKTTTFVTSQSKEPSRVFKPVTSFTPGKNYIIVNSSSVGASYYMNNTPASSATRLGRTYAVIQPDESDNSVFIEIPVADGGAGIWTAAASGTDGYVTLQNEESAQYLSLTYVSGGYATVATADAVSSSDSDPFAFGVNSSGRVIGLDANSSGTNVVIRYSGDGNFRGGNADDSESSGVYLFEETVLEQAVHIRSMYQNIDGTVAERKDVCKWQTETLLPRPVNFDTEDITYTWESSNPGVATVDENGVVTYTGAGGETVITLTATSNKASLDGTYPTATATTTLKVIENSINGIPEGTYRYVITDHFEPGQIYAFSHSNAVGNHHIMNCWPYDYSSTEKRLYDNVEDFYDSAYGVYFDCSDKSIGWECIATDTDGQYYFKSIQTGQYLVLNNSGGVRSVTVSDTLTEYSDSAYRISYNTTKMNPYSAQSVSSENYMSPNSDGSSYRLSTDPSPVYIYKQSDGSEFSEVKAQIRIDAYGGNKDITNVLQNRYDVYPGMTERLLSYVVGLENITVTWESDNTNVASVDNEGLVTYTGLEGFASITMTVTGTNAAGETVTMSVRTTLSPNPESYTSPTEDYPEYPHEGSVRIGKTASGTAGGYNFQTSGVTEVELGVTGVPMTQPVDVVIVFDHSSSMNSNNRLTNAIADTRDFALQLVNKNEKNRIAIVTFDKYTEVFQSFTSTSPSYTTSGDENRIVTGDGTPEGAFVTIDDAEKMVSQIDSLQYNDIAGTNYDDGLSKCYQILKASQNDPNANKKKYVIFMSDGEPYVFNRVQLTYDDVTTAWLTGDETQATLATYLKDPSKYPVADYFNTDGNNWFAEAIKAPLGSDVDLPSVSYYDGYRTGLGATVFSIGYSSDARGSLTEGVLQRIASSEENFYRADSNLQEAYDRILESILYAANEAVVTDKMGENYNLQFAQSFTLGNSMATINLDPAPYIEVGSWTLNSDGSRNEYTSIEKITFETNSSGALTAAYSDLIDSGTTNIYDVSSNKIIGKYVTYDVLNEEFKWNIGDIDRDEVTLKYYAYLEGSAEGERAAGTYDTNEYAVLDYHNYLDNVCQQTFPVPSLGWKEAAVNYEFYLVNENGQPVNSEGVVVPFEERVLIGNKQTETVLLNSSGELSAIELIASEKIPEGYTLFNPDAQYSVRISSGDNASEAEIIDEGKSVVTTYYYDGTTKYNQSGIVPNASEYTNTNVAFAVLYQTGIIPDSVVIDYGLPVKISVLANDLIKTGTINAIGTQIADDTVLNNTGYTESKLLDASDKLTLENGEASVSDKQIIYQPTNMTMSDEEVFYYEFKTSSGTYFYTTVTVIPATNIYYEDSFITFNDSPGYEWQTEGTTYTDKFQAEDRPGTFSLSQYDANNVYGRDDAYADSVSTYSLGSAKSVVVDEASLGKEPTAQFTFCGTGFDLFSVTNADTGAMLVAVYDSSGKRIKNYIVQTYYGYSYDEEQGQFVPNPTSTDGLYQVPVIRARDFDYGTYKVVITPKYGWAFDMNYDKTGENYNAYKVYIDSVRIYDPAGTAPDPDSVVGEAYIKDKEYIPQYMEIRDTVISAETFYDCVYDLDESQYTKGSVFIDGISSLDNTGISDKYLESGPNNELYLAKGQAIAFHVTSDRAIEPESLQLGMKVVAGDSSGTLLCMNSNYTTPTTVSVYGGHEMFRRLTSFVVWDEALKEQGIYKTKYPIIIINNSDSLISLTNFKWTYSEPESTSEANGLSLAVTSATPRMALMALRSFALSDETADDAFEPQNVSVEWENSSVKQFDTAVLRIRTDLDVTAVTVDGEKVTDCKIDENGQKLWTFSLNAERYGEKVCSVILSNEDGTESEPIETPVLKIEKLPVCERIRSIEWENASIKQNQTAVLKITTDLDVTAVTVDGVDVTECETVYDESMSYQQGTKVWTYSFKAENVGKLTCNVTCFDAENDSAEAVTKTLTVKKLNIIDKLIAIIQKLIAIWRNLF